MYHHSLASKSQLRLDEELRASGFSQQHDAELYYYQSQTTSRVLFETTRKDEDDEEEEEEEEEDENDDEEDDNESDDEIVQHQVPHVYDNNDDNDAGSIDNDCSSGEESDGISNMQANSMAAAARISLINDDEWTVLTEQSRAVAIETAKVRVQQHMDALKKKNSRNQAFKSRNSNKTFVKGKRIYKNDMGQDL
jgi:hypothetical protein